MRAMDSSYRPSRRRSVPRLPEFSITPLRTYYQTDVDNDHSGHSYSQPQTPHSPHSAFQSPSHTPTLLSRASSRDPSGTGRRRKVKSALLLADLERPLTQRVEDDVELPKKSKSSLRLHKVHTDPSSHSVKGHVSKSKSIGGSTTGAKTSLQSGMSSDWLISTASVLAMTAAESKGQSWLVTKSASTSLVATPHVERDEFMFRPLTRTHDGEDLLNSPAVSGSASRRNSLPASRSRGASRAASRMGSRVGSRASLTALGRKTPGENDGRADYFSNMGVDFADQDEEDYSDDELDEYEENELKKLVWGRVGGWVDWAVGWMDWRDGLEGIEDDDDEQEDTAPEDGPKQKRKKRATIKLEASPEEINTSEASIPAPPPQAGLVGDAKWLLGVVGQLIV